MNSFIKKSIVSSYITMLLVILIVFDTNSQAKYEAITTADGLSQGMIFDMIQDKEGFIWIATKDALNRYDGYEFKVFTNDPFNNSSLSYNTVVRLFEDSKGRIWAGTENSGLNIYYKEKGVFYRLENNLTNTNSISGNNIRAIEELPDGRMLIATVGNGLNIITLPDDFFTKNTQAVITRLTMPKNTEVYGIGKDKNGGIFIGGMDGSVFEFNPKELSFEQIFNGKLYNNGYLTEDTRAIINHNLFLDDGKNISPLFDTEKISEGNIIFRPNSALWDLHHRELFFYDISRWEKDRSVNWNEILPIDKNTRIIYPFIIDKSGLLWTGTVGYGLLKYDIIESKFKTIAKGNSLRLIKPLSDNEILCVDYGYPWMKIKDDQVIDENFFNKIPSITQIDNIIISKTNDIYIKSDNKGYFKYKPATNEVLSLPRINAKQTFGKKQPFIEDKSDCIWFPGVDGIITLFNTSTQKLDSININPSGAKLTITALHEERKDDIFWVGTETGFAKIKINRKKLSASKVIWFYNNPNDRNSLSYGHVTCFLDDPHEPSKYLWLSTKGGGINRLNKLNSDFLHLSVKEGLPDNVVYGILDDESGNIWGSTNKGIFCLMIQNNAAKTTYIFRHFTKKEGLQDDEFNTGAYAKFPNGNLAFAGVNGLNIFDPKKVLLSGFVPKVWITKILVGNNPVSPNDKTGVLNESIEYAKTITLTHLQDILTLEFSSLDFKNPGQNKYRYQLVGIDKEFVESNNRRSATYLHLPSGKYFFKVQGSNGEGIWSEKFAELEIVVLPPYWKTWWAYLTYILLIGFSVRWYIKNKLNKTKIEAQLEFEKKEAKRIKELDAMKTQLYTNITHEFRTPLTVILGMAQQIKNGVNEQLDNSIDMIIRSGNNLLKLVNEMLDLSKIEAGKMELKLIDGDVVQFLRYIVESFSSMAESQHKSLHYLSSIDSLYASYDTEKLRQIVSNLLSNALKFTNQKGNIYISISAQESSEQGFKILEVRVKDTGIGISEGQIPNIFDRFYQVDTSHSRKAEGTGIGLALTKDLIQLMGGQISAKSPPIGAKVGSEFTFTIPLTLVEPSSDVITDEGKLYTDLLSPSFETNQQSDFKQAAYFSDKESELILLVEDNKDVVAYTASCLTEYRLAVGKDGQEGFDIAVDLIPDLIISDVMMPNVDGFEMCKRLRKHELTSHIPIIMLTAKADMESKLEGLGHGVDAYMEKPFYKEELKLRIKKLLEQRRLLQNVYSRMAGIYKSQDPLFEDDTNGETILHSDVPVKENEFVQKVRQQIENNISDENFSVEQLSKNMFMSYSQLHRKLSAVLGYSPNQFIKNLRLQKSTELLKNTNESIANISSQCGFNDHSYFGKVFRQEYGTTPQDYRKDAETVT